MGLNWTSESKRLPVRICPSLPCLNLSGSIGFRPYAEIRRKVLPFLFAMGFIFQQRASQYIININRTCVSNVMVVRICVGIPYQLSCAMIYYRPQSEIRVKTFARRNSLEPYLLNFDCLDRLPNLFGDSSENLWSFELMMSFIFQQRVSQYIININRTPVSKVMVIWISVFIPYRLLSAMIYYGAQLDIRVKTFARQNLPKSSLLHFECLNRFPDYADIRREGYGRLYLRWASFINNERLNIS